MYYVLIALLSFLIGSIPNGLIVGKLMRGVDVRQYGSKNIGATNAFRVLGPGPAVLVLVTDAVKGMIGVYLGQILIGTSYAQLLGGIAAIAGHNWSIFLGFKGGRGVATGLGVIAVLVPKVTAVVFVVWAVIVFFTRLVSLGSIVAAALVPISMYFFGEEPEILAFGVIAAAFVIFRHRPNIERLLKGEEQKIKAGNVTKDNKSEEKKS